MGEMGLCLCLCLDALPPKLPFSVLPNFGSGHPRGPGCSQVLGTGFLMKIPAVGAPAHLRSHFSAVRKVFYSGVGGILRGWQSSAF